MSVAIITIVVVAVCVAVGYYLYLHGGPDGGKDPGLGEMEGRRQRMARRKGNSMEERERRYQEKLGKKREHEEP